MATLVGLISDTHGLLRPQALLALAGADLLIHGGDIGAPDILAELAALAPLTVVRGNNDGAAWAASIPVAATLEVEGVRIHAIHDVKQLATLPDGVDVVVSGHSHKPSVVRRGGILYVNPGSAGRRRFSLPISVARLHIEGGAVDAEIVTLQVP